MPNWVYNYASITGSVDDVDKFLDHIKTRPERISENDWQGPESTLFSYHSFITLPDDVTDEEYHGTHGSGPDGPLGDTPGNWYNWNTDNWGCKWDASSVEMSTWTDEPNSWKEVNLRFESPWSPPEPVFSAMVEKFPSLDFRIEYEEEQGWGGIVDGKGGVATTVKTWDIPASHTDYVDLDREDSCNCAHDDDKRNWYDDCPGKHDTLYRYTIQVVNTYVVVAPDAEHASNAVEAYDSDYSLPENTEVVSVNYKSSVEVTEGEQVERPTESA